MFISEVKHNKKKKRTYVAIELDVFHCRLNLHVLSKFKNLPKKLTDTVDLNAIKHAGGFVDKEIRNFETEMVLKPDIGAGDLAHECKHFMNTVYMHIGHRTDADNDEIECYLLGHFIDLVTQSVNDHKKKFKIK